MKEIEIKAHAANHEELKRTIEGLCPLGSIHTSDTYYFSPDQGRDASLFRLRLSGGKGIVTRKQRKRIGALEVNDEIEYEVSDPEAFREFSESLGYEVYVRKEKRGFIGSLDTMTVGLWEVPPLGWFIEVEILSETDDEKTVEAAKDQIVSFLNELGIPSEAHEPRYYMEMLLSQ